MSRRRTQPTPYKITRLQYIKQTVAALTDDLSRPWSDYPCLPWPYATQDHGYGRITVRKGKCEYPHRLAYWEVHPDTDRSLHICHHCDWPTCFRPAHLFSGTPADNSADKVAKGRARCGPGMPGESNPHAILTWEIVRKIRLLRSQGWVQTKIAAECNTTQSSVSLILLNRAWKESANPLVVTPVQPVQVPAVADLPVASACRPSRQFCLDFE